MAVHRAVWQALTPQARTVIGDGVFLRSLAQEGTLRLLVDDPRS